MEGLYILIAFICGFLVAQIAKLLLVLISCKGKMTGEDALKWLARSGGMPSGHAASFTAATMCVGLFEGFTSAIFALAVCMTIIIVYDAVNVRYAVGEHGKYLAALEKERGSKYKLGRIVEGHTVPQVLVGILIGLLVGWGVFMIFG